MPVKDISVRKTDIGTQRAQCEIIFNHPSIIYWSLGSETVNGPNFTAAYQWIKSQDQSRPIQWEQGNKGPTTDIYCPMYLSGGLREICAQQCARRPETAHTVRV